MNRVPVLPKEAYTSQEWFKKEQKEIFSKTWQFAGFVEDVKEPGDLIMVQSGLYNLILTMTNSRELRVFHNMCRHRGTQLLRTVGKRKKVFTCPYHDWSYSLEGELISVPEEKTEFPNLDKKKFCLHQGSVGIWRGMLFVHPKKDSEPIEDWFGKVNQHLGPHNPDTLVEYPDTNSETMINANWKIVVENFVDVYHLSHLHSNTLNMYDHKNQESGFVGPHFWFEEPLMPQYEENLSKISPVKQIPETVGTELKAHAPFLFPNLGLTETETIWSIFHVIPISAKKTKVITRTKFAEMSNWEFTKQSAKSAMNWSSVMGWKPKYGEAHSDEDPMTSGDIMAEDIYACEQLQAAMESPNFEVGVTAKNLEKSIIEFQTIVQEYMTNS
ncbi:MAG: aromatic ring-hydroxylating oxygenase subunit alpha [Flavobacteriales bacterium]